MADETKIGLKLEKELQIVEDICKKIQETIKHEFDGGIENINTHEMGEVIDMYKDMAESKEKIIKACYYKQIMEAMENAEYGEDYDEYGPTDEPRYYNMYRYANGRYAPKGRGARREYQDTPYWHVMPEYYRDMDRNYGRMYYVGQGTSTSGNMRGNQSGNMGGQSESSSRGYSEGYDEGYNRGRSEGQMMNQRDRREGRSGQSRRTYMETKEMNADNTAEAKQAKMRELEKYMNELSSDVSEMISGASNEEKTMLRTKLQNLQQKIV